MGAKFWTDNSMIDELTETLGNRFTAINYLSSLARKKAEDVNDVILHSHALNWILTGEVPYVVEHPVTVLSEREQQIEAAYDYLLYVEDREVATAAESSLHNSLEFNHLTYIYNNINDLTRQARVRVITRMLWALLI